MGFDLCSTAAPAPHLTTENEEIVFLSLYSFMTYRVAKCHGYDGYIRVKIFAGWGKKSGRAYNLAKLSQFWEDLNNLCKISVYKPA